MVQGIGVVSKKQFFSDIKIKGFTGQEARKAYNLGTKLEKDGNRKELSDTEYAFMNHAIEKVGINKSKQMLGSSIPISVQKDLRSQFKTFQETGEGLNMSNQVAKLLNMAPQKIEPALSKIDSKTQESLFKSLGNLDQGGEKNKLDPSEEKVLTFLAKGFYNSPHQDKIVSDLKSGQLGGQKTDLALGALYSAINPDTSQVNTIFSSANRGFGSSVLKKANAYFENGTTETNANLFRTQNKKSASAELKRYRY